MRGRAIAMWQVAFQGTTPIGGPAIGWIIALTDPRIGLAVGGASCFVAALGGVALARRSRPSPHVRQFVDAGSASIGPMSVDSG